MVLRRRRAISTLVIAIVVIVIVAAAAVVGYLYLAKPAPKTTIKIGLDIAETGIYSAPDSDVLWGYQYVINQTNAAGGVYISSLGHNATLQLVTLDDQSNPTLAATNTEQLITTDKVNFMLSGFGADIVAAEAGVAQKSSMLMVSTGSGDSIYDTGNYTWIFLPFINIQGQTQPFITFMNSFPANQRPQKLALWCEQSSLGVDSCNNWDQLFTAAGFQVVYRGNYATGATDFSSLILGAKQAGAQAVFDIPIGPDGVTTMKQMNQLGYTPWLIDMQRGAETPYWYAGLGNLSTGTLDTNIWTPTLTTHGTAQVDAAYLKDTGQSPSMNVGAGVVGAQVLVQAIEKAASLNVNDVRQALKTDTFQTIGGPMTFPLGYGHASLTLYMMQWQNGVMQTIGSVPPGSNGGQGTGQWSTQYATAPVIYPFKWVNSTS